MSQAVSRTTSSKGGRVLAVGRYVSDDDLASGMNHNDLIIGCSGSGKTGGYVISNIRRGHGSMVITDTKGQLYHRLGKELEDAGYKVYLLDFVNSEYSMGYNPLEYIRKKPAGLQNGQNGQRGSVYCTSDIVSMAHILCPVRQDDREPFWQQSAQTVVAFLIAFVLEALVPEEHNMISVVNLFRELGVPSGRKAIEQWCNDNPYSFAAKKYGMFCGIYDADHTRPTGRLPVPVRSILDDFAANAYIENFDKPISVIRSRNISVSVILQNMPQLYSLYSEADASTILNNCDHILYLGGQDVTTAEYVGLRANRTAENVLLMPCHKASLVVKIAGRSEKGAFWLSVSVTGVSSHASRPDLGVNAVEAAYTFAEQIKQYINEKEIHPILGAATASVTKLTGGIMTNMIPPHAELEMDIRTVPGISHTDILAYAKTCAEILKGKFPGNVFLHGCISVDTGASGTFCNSRSGR